MPKRILSDFSFLQHLRRPAINGRSVSNLIGRKFDRITPLGFLGIGNQGAKWLCRCDCGSIWVVTSVKLTQGTTHSCGCYQIELLIARSITHGMSGPTGPRIYSLWADTHTRCYNQNSQSYPDWGGRGIRVCQRWHSFACYYEDMQDPPSAEHSPDRINNNGNYSCGKCSECLENGWPMNVHWATRIQQARNKRNNRLLTANGETLCIAEWAERDTTPNARTIWKRLNRGWSVNEALGFVQRT